MSVSDIKEMATSENSSRTTGNRLEGKVAIVTGIVPDPVPWLDVASPAPAYG